MIQCPVNLSTSNKDFIEKIVNKLEKFAMVSDYSSDIDHNRSVITLIGNREEIFDSMKVFGECASLIDLREHKGAHPRVGSVDVVPFVPLRDETMDTCVELAHKVGHLFFEEYNIPVFFYEEAATKEENRYLENCRSCNYKTLDLGKEPNPITGASCIGARKPLIAYNVNLDTDNIKIAKIIAKEIRDMRKAGNPNMYGVKAMGLYLEKQNIVQVTTNITRCEFVGVYEVFSYIQKRAKDFGVSVLESELIGALPFEESAAIINKFLKFKDFNYKKMI